MDVRIGYSNEHITGNNADSLSSPEYATAIGLLMRGFEMNIAVAEIENKKHENQGFTNNLTDTQKASEQDENQISQINNTKDKKKSFSFLKDWSDKFIEIFNQAE
jgi:cell division protein FtsA